MKKALLTKLMLLLCALIAGSSSVWATDVTYTVTSKTAVSTSGTAIAGSSAAYTQTHNTVKQATSGNSFTLTLSGYNGYNITKLVMSMKSNASSGAGKLSYSTDGGTSFTYIVGSSSQGVAFNQAAWNGSYTTSYTDITKDNLSIACSSSNVIIKIEATANSLYCESYTITYESASDPRAATSVTLKTGYSTEAYMGESIVSPSLNKVSTASADIDGATVTWSSTNTNVATIENDGTITLVGTGTTKIKANYAGDANNYKPSEASYDLAVYASYSGIEALQAAATSTSTKMKVTFTNAKVTALKDARNAYIVEGEKGIIIYNSTAHGLTAGQTINGSLKGANVVLYKGATEITGFTTTGLTITDGSVPDAVVKTIGDLSANNVGLIATINEVTYNASNKEFSDGANTIAFYDTFSQNPTLEDGKTYNVTGMVNYYNGLQISPLAASGVTEVTNKTAPTSNWKSGGNVVTSMVYTKGDAFSATFETNSTGDKSFESSNPTVATVDNNGVITLTGAVGITTITATTAANSSYFVSNASLTITVREPIENAVFNFGNYQDYGSGVVPTSAEVYVEGEEKTWTAGDITLTTNGKIRWYIGNSGLDLKLYTKKVSNVETTKIKLSAPSGKKLTKFVITGSGFGSMTADKGTYNSGTWTGSEDDVTLTHSGSGTTGISTITVFYTGQELPVSMGNEGYMTYCNKNAALSFGDLEAYIVSAVGDDNVTLSPITQAPANTPVVLKGSAGLHNLTVLASADAVGTNKLNVSGGAITTTDSKTVYALAEKGGNIGFYKVQAGVNVPEGKCYVQVNNTTAPEFLGFDFNGETTGINMVHGSEFKVNGEIYNLNGQRVAQPTKGLYIVNGKKIIVK